MTEQPFVMLYITTSSQEESIRLGKAMVEEKLAACANVLPQMLSVYQWKGSLQEDRESVLLLKTRASFFEKVSKRMEELHSYECPCILCLPIEKGNQKYLDWLEEQTSS